MVYAAKIENLLFLLRKEVTFWWDHECVSVRNNSNQFIFRNFPTEFPSSHADCLTGDQAPCLRSRAGE